MRRVALMPLFTACQAVLDSSGGGGASVRYVIALMVLPSPGGVVTVLARFEGNLKKPGSRPSALPARSGLGPSNGTYVGSLTAPPEGVPPPAEAPPPLLLGAGEEGGVQAASSEAPPTAPRATRPLRTTKLRRVNV